MIVMVFDWLKNNLSRSSKEDSGNEYIEIDLDKEQKQNK